MLKDFVLGEVGKHSVGDGIAEDRSPFSHDNDGQTRPGRPSNRPIPISIHTVIRVFAMTSKEEVHRHLVIQCHPTIADRRELETILLCSLKDLFGLFSDINNMVSVLDTNRNKALLRCHQSHVSSVRAALTFCSPPPYLVDQYCSEDGDDTDFVFAFDVLEICNGMPAGWTSS